MKHDFFAGKLLKFIRNKEDLEYPMFFYTAWDLLFKAAMVGLLLYIPMIICRQLSYRNFLYNAIISGIFGVAAAGYDFIMVRTGKVKQEEAKATDKRDEGIIMLLTAFYVAFEIMMLAHIITF